MTLQVYTSPRVLTIVSFRLFGEFRLVHVFLSFGHSEDCVVVFLVVTGAAADERRRFIVGLQHSCGNHRKTDTGRDSTAADAQEIVGGTTTANDKNACPISLSHCVKHNDERTDNTIKFYDAEPT